MILGRGGEHADAFIPEPWDVPPLMACPKFVRGKDLTSARAYCIDLPSVRDI